MVIHGAGASDVGRKRSENQDLVYVNDGRGLYVVCDGMGGHTGGRVAAEAALRSIVSCLTDDRLINRDPVDVVKRSLETANEAIIEQAATEDDWYGMGSTATVLYFDQSKAHVGHVGDTRLYLVRAGFAQQLTVDHTVASAMATAGIISPDEVRTHPRANILMRALGGTPNLVVDAFSIVTQPGDLFIICSDGLTRYLETPSEVATMAQYRVEDIPRALIDLANSRGGQDNVAVVSVLVAHDGAPTAVWTNGVHSVSADALEPATGATQPAQEEPR